MLTFTDCQVSVNLQPKGQSKVPTGDSRKEVQEMLDPMLEQAQKWRDPQSLCFCWPPWGLSVEAGIIMIRNKNIGSG